VAQHYEEFYEDVHSEFLQFGELVNFKVCNNASSHLRGNLYVHYKAEAGAQAAYSALNGRFYAGKQVSLIALHINLFSFTSYLTSWTIELLVKAPKEGTVLRV
jgi:hypothetical protein